MGNRRMGPMFAVAAVAFSTVVFAQTQAKPGEPGAKPIPRTADGKPDLTGLWANIPEVVRARTPQPEGASGARQQRQQDMTGNTPAPEPMALTPWAAERLLYNKDPLYTDGEARVRNELDPSSHCFPPGPVRLAQPFQILQTPREVWIIYETNHEVRQIFTDGRKHPEDLELSWNGHSIGAWNGDTLVVDTIGTREETLLDPAGHVHSGQLHIVERFRRPAYDVLEIERTLTDPKALAKPYTRTTKVSLAPPDWDLLEDVTCDERYRKGIFFGEGPSGL